MTLAKKTHQFPTLKFLTGGPPDVFDVLRAGAGLTELAVGTGVWGPDFGLAAAQARGRPFYGGAGVGMPGTAKTVGPLPPGFAGAPSGAAGLAGAVGVGAGLGSGAALGGGAAAAALGGGGAAAAPLGGGGAPLGGSIGLGTGGWGLGLGAGGDSLLSGLGAAGVPASLAGISDFRLKVAGGPGVSGPEAGSAGVSGAKAGGPDLGGVDAAGKKGAPVPAEKKAAPSGKKGAPPGKKGPPTGKKGAPALPKGGKKPAVGKPKVGGAAVPASKTKKLFWDPVADIEGTIWASKESLGIKIGDIETVFAKAAPKDVGEVKREQKPKVSNK